MRRQWLRVGVATFVVALVVGVTAPAFAADAPPPTTDPAVTEPSTTTPPSDGTAPDTTTPDTTTPDSTAPGTTAPDTTSPDAATPDTTAPATTAPDTTAPDTVTPQGAPSASDAPVAQVTPVVTVTPSTNLVHLQSVTIAGSGFTPNVTVGFAECHNTNSGDANDCDTAHTGVAATDGTGAFSATFNVRRTLHTNNGDVDCAAAPATCNIGAAKITDYAEHAGAPLAFDPNAPLPPPPTLVAGPTDDLVDGDSIAMFGGKFVPNSQVAIVQCSQPTIQTCQTLLYTTADANGGFIAIVQVHRLLATPPFGATDCADAPGTCQLRAVSLADYDFEAHVLLGFDPNGPLPPGAVTVTPDTNLLNFQHVTVAGTEFPASSGVQIVECKSDATSYEDCTNGYGGFAPVGADGRFSTSLSVRRILHLEGGDFDCASAPGACSLVTTAYGVPSVVVTTPISFDSSVPPPPPPTISVTPSSGLVQNQSVTVTGANFAPSSSVALSQCAEGSPPGYCAYSGSYVNTDANGSFTGSFVVKRGVPDFSSYPPAVLDCASAPQACEIVATSQDFEDYADQPVDFDASVPIEVPDVDVTPQFDLPDRAIVHVHSSGFAPFEQVLVSQCPADAPNFGYSCGQNIGPVNLLAADANGEVDTSLRVHRDLTTFDGIVIIAGQTSCADSVGACVIRVQSTNDPLALTDVPLGFDPTAVAPPPALTVTPAGSVTDGQQVEVHGSGYTPGAVLGMAQCETDGFQGGSTCDSGPDGLFSEFRADADGTFTRTVTLHTEVQGTDGPIDCSAAGSCILFAANRNDYGLERASVPIVFAEADTDANTGVGVRVLGATATRALAFTGAGGATMPTALVAFGLLVVGGALLLLARRRTGSSS